MIIREQIGDGLVRIYSDQNVYIHGGFPESNYEEAIDPADIERTYTETNIPIIKDNPEDNEAQEAIRVLLDL